MELFSLLQDWRQLIPYLALLAAGLITGKVLRPWFGSASKGKEQQGDTTDVAGLPWLGNAVALGRHGAAFVAACRHKYGDVFTLTLAGQKMQFWLEPALINYFFSAPEDKITFRPAVEQFTQRVFGLPSKLFFPKHSKVLQDLRELLVPSNLAVHAAALAAALDRRMGQNLPHGQEVDLYAAVRRLVFGAGVETLFGPGATEGEEEATLEEEFHAFECGFELAASPVPHALQPRFCTARDALLAWLGRAAGRGALEGTTAGILLAKADLPPELAPHLLLAVLWASQANTVAASFWSIALLLLPQHAQWREEVMSDLNKLAAAGGGGGGGGGEDISGGKAAGGGASLGACAAVRALDRRSAACRCAAEAVRLRVQSIDVRMAASTFTITTATGRKVVVPKGCILAINPYVTHHDPGVYPEPLAFNPDRGVADLGEGGPVVPAVAGLAFGAGPYRCPGRFFAEMEVALVAQVVLSSRQLSLSSLPPDHPASPADAAPPVRVPGQLAGGISSALGHLQGFMDQTMKGLLGTDLAMWGMGVDLPIPSQPGGGRAPNPSDALTPGRATDPVRPAGAGSQVVGSSEGVDESKGVDESGTEGGERWQGWLHHSADPGRLLPPPDLKRLVGVKAPAEPCWVKVASRAARQLQHQQL